MVEFELPLWAELFQPEWDAQPALQLDQESEGNHLRTQPPISNPYLQAVIQGSQLMLSLSPTTMEWLHSNVASTSLAELLKELSIDLTLAWPETLLLR